MISGSKKTGNETSDFSKRVGIFEAIPIAVNPSREDLEKMLNTSLEREYEYTGQDDSGNQKLTLSIWMKEVENGELFNVRFYLINKEKESMQNPGNFQYINEVGVCTWSKDGSVPEWFGRREFRKALVGEEELHEFIRSWVNLDYSDPSTTVLLDTRKLFKGDLSEINSAIKNFNDNSVCALACVRTVTGEDGNVEYQTVYNKRFLPGTYMKFFKGAKGTTKPKMVENFIKNVTDKTHGCKDFYKIEALSSYNSEENGLATNASIIGTPTSDGGIY